nr:isoprenylcysteine carboxylmethyltransferase family protein [Robertmurraya massiliosenegalensis]
MMKLLIVFIILQRVVEMFIARRNEKWLKNQGGIEIGQAHYRYMIIIHVLFFVSLVTEIVRANSSIHPIWPLILVLFLLTQLGRVWVIYSLGRHWNTKIIVIPEVQVVRKGPYRFLKHPNYVIVTLELMIIPLLYEAYITGLIFTILNIWILSIRIPAEEKALHSLTEYEKVFMGQNRFLPSFLKKV